MKEKTKTELLADITETIRIDVSIVTTEQETIRKDQEQAIKSILGKNHSGELDVREVMNGIFGRELSEKEFGEYYQIYALGFNTGRSLGYTKMLRSLKWLQYLLGKPVKKQVNA